MAQDNPASEKKSMREPPALTLPPPLSVSASASTDPAAAGPVASAEPVRPSTAPPPLPGDAFSAAPQQPASEQSRPESGTPSGAAAKGEKKTKSRTTPDGIAGLDRGPAGARSDFPPPPAITQSADSAPARRAARRRPAGPVRNSIPANDDVPSIGGLIYALDQKPSNTPFRYAAYASGAWCVISLAFSWHIFATKLHAGMTLGAALSEPTTFLMMAAIVVPLAIMWFLALLAWRAEELRLRSSTMTEVAIRLAEPDRMAEQSIASLGQAVRRQVSFMNDAVSRALGRAGELEALVHNEVAALERSYEENERRIRGLIQELSGERSELLGTSERVTETLRALGAEVPQLIERLSSQQIKLAQIIQIAGENLTSLETAVGQTTERLETTIGERTEQLQTVLETYTGAIGQAIGSRTEEIQVVLEGYTAALADALAARTETIQLAFHDYLSALNASLDDRTANLQTVFEEYARALDTSLANRAEILDGQLVERTRALDAAFSARLQAFDESIKRSTFAIDHAVGERAAALTSALDNHARTFSETIQRQTAELDEQLVQGISAVRRTSENITRQSLKAIEGLANQSEMLQNVSENLLGQISSVTNRFENQGQTIMRAANALEAVNFKIDTTLQNRHAALAQTLEAMSDKAAELDRVVQGYSSTIEGTLTEAELRARAAAEQLRLGAENTRRAALADLDRLKAETDAESARRLEELRQRFANISTTVSQEIDSLYNRVDTTAEEARKRAQRTATEIAAEQARLMEQLNQLPAATRESAEGMRRALAEQLKALDQIAALSQRTELRRDFMPPTTATPSNLSTASPTPPSPIKTAGMPQTRATLAEGAAREGWSLGDLLARASRDEELAQSRAARPLPPEGAPPAAQPYKLDIDVIARALDGPTTAALWSRLNAGHRGVLSRGLYSSQGRAAFDEIASRLTTDRELASTVMRYLEDFESIRRDLDARDPTGRLTAGHLNSDSGRVYLLLAHAAGRIA